MEIYSIRPKSENTIMMATASISCGEPSEICTGLERVDLNEFITGGQNDIYLIKADSDSMEHEIRSGDYMIVDRNLQPNFGNAVVAVVNDRYTVKDFKPKENGILLEPKNNKYQALLVTDDDDFETFGVVTGIIRKFKKI